jgi:hypothetical protein
MACDSLQWRDRRLFYTDTLGIPGPVGSRLAQEPVDTLVTVGGCDSVVNLDLAIRHSTYHCDIDTFCWNELYYWRTQVAGDTLPAHRFTTDHYYLSETLQTHRFYHPSDPEVNLTCDSVRAIQLAQMAKPQLHLRDTVDCMRDHYTLTLVTDVPYHRWESEGWRTEDSIIEVSPRHVTLYRAYTDYHEVPLCPVSDSIRRSPIVIPEAAMKLNPEAVTYADLEFDADDISNVRPSSYCPDSALRWERRWLIDWIGQFEPSTHLHGTASLNADTAVVALEVWNGQCYDTAVHLLPVLRVALFAPNVITPASNDENSRFIIVTQGVASGKLYIYNREGLLLYHNDDYTLGWDGRTLDGRICPQGAYVWKLEYTSVDHPADKQTQVGTVTLLH